MQSPHFSSMKWGFFCVYYMHDLTVSKLEKVLPFIPCHGADGYVYVVDRIPYFFANSIFPMLTYQYQHILSFNILCAIDFYEDGACSVVSAIYYE